MAVVGETLDFLIAGVGKSGTTTLADSLARHPDIAMTRPKEPWFFDSDNYTRGMGWYWQHYLGHYNGERCVGEASSQTLFVPFALQRVHARMPEVKLIVVLRDPVERAHSDWWMKYCTGLERDNFAVALDKNLAQQRSGVDFADPGVWQAHLDAHSRRLALKTYLDYGNYSTQLERCYRYFPREQVHLLTTDALQRDYAGTLAGVWTFLGVAPGGAAMHIAPRRENPSRSPLLGALRRRLTDIPGVERVLRGARAGGARLTPAPVRRTLRKTLRAIDRGEKPPMPAAQRRELEDYYRDEMLRLRRLTGRDFAEWRWIDGEPVDPQRQR